MSDEKLRAAALAVVAHAKQTGSITVKLREDLAEALGLPREYARGRHNRAASLYDVLAEPYDGDPDDLA